MNKSKTVKVIEINAQEGNMQSLLQDALNSASKVVLTCGVFLTGPLAVPSDTELQIDKNATLKFIADFDMYPPVFTRWEGVKCWCMHPCLWVNEAENVYIHGEGVIDGSGEPWWNECDKKRSVKSNRPTLPVEKRFEKMNPEYLEQPGGGGGRQTQFLRPALLQIKSSRKVRVEGLNILNSPFWTIHPLFSSHLIIRNVHIKNPYTAPNTDGIDIESCNGVVVENSVVDVGDDGIALKSGSGPDGIEDGIPSENIAIKSCTVKSAHGGAVIGSETAGGVNNIFVEDCFFDGTDRGVRIKTRRGRGGSIHDLYFKNITMKDNLCPFVINMFYRCGGDGEDLFSLEPQEITDATPEIYNVFLSGCKATGSRSSAGMIVGLPEKKIANVCISDCDFEVSPNADRCVSESDMYLGIPTPESRGFRIRYAKDLKLDNLVVKCDGEKILIEDGVELE